MAKNIDVIKEQLTLGMDNKTDWLKLQEKRNKVQVLRVNPG